MADVEGGYSMKVVPPETRTYTLRVYPEIEFICDACLMVIGTFECPPGLPDLDILMEAHQCPAPSPA